MKRCKYFRKKTFLIFGRNDCIKFKQSEFFATFLTFFVCCLTLPSKAVYAETRGYVISMLHTATNEDPRNCPKGGNGDAKIRAYKLLGYSESEIAEMLNGKYDAKELIHIASYRGRIDNKLVNVHSYPTAVPDQNLELVNGSYAYGFDLDAKGANQKSAFEDPETHETGVDNQLFRAVGCFGPYRIQLPARPFFESALWLVYDPPTWLFTITTEDFNRDGDAKLFFYKSIDPLRRNPVGDTLPNTTYRIDPNPYNYGKLRGTLKEGVFTSSSDDASLRLEGEGTTLHMTKLEMSNVHLRLNLNADHTVAGYLGGYLIWRDFWFMNNAAGEGTNIDTSALYYMLRRLADARPDPHTGQNTAISTTYRIEAVPAFVVKADGEHVTDTHGFLK